MKRKTKVKLFLAFGTSIIMSASIASATLIMQENINSQNLIETNGKTLNKSHILGTVLDNKNNQINNNNISNNSNLISYDSNTNILNNITLPSHLFSEQKIDLINNEFVNKYEPSYNFASNSLKTNNNINNYVKNSEKKVVNYIQQNGLQKSGFNKVLENQLGVSSTYVNNVVDNANTLQLAWDNTLFSWTHWNLNYWLNDHSLASTLQGFNQIATENGWWFFPLFQNNKQIPSSQYTKFIKAITLVNVSNHTYYVEIVPQNGVNIDLTQNDINVDNYKINVTISNGNVSTINIDNLKTNSALMNIYEATQSIAKARISTNFSDYTSADFTGNYSVMTQQRLLAWDEAQYINSHGYSNDYSNAISDWYKMNYAYDLIPTLNKSWVSYYKYQLYVFNFYINRVSEIYQSVLNQVSSQINSLPSQISSLQNEINGIKTSNSTINEILNLQTKLTYDEAQYMQAEGYMVSSQVLSEWNTANTNYNWLIDNESQNLDVIENSVPYLMFSSFVTQTNKLYQAVVNDVAKNSSTLQKSYLETLISTLNVTVQFGLSKTNNGHVIWNSLDWISNVFDKTYVQMINDEYDYVKISTTNSTILSDMNLANAATISFSNQISSWLKQNSNYKANKLPHDFYILQLSLQDYAKWGNSIYESVANPYQEGLKIMQNAESNVLNFSKDVEGAAIAATVATGVGIALAAAYWAASWFFGITIPDAIAATAAAAATSVAMGLMWASFSATNKIAKDIEGGISNWIFYANDANNFNGLYNTWTSFRELFDTNYFYEIVEVEGVMTTEEVPLAAADWANPILTIIGGVNTILAAAILISSIAIQAVRNTPLNIIY